MSLFPFIFSHRQCLLLLDCVSDNSFGRRFSLLFITSWWGKRRGGVVESGVFLFFFF